MAEPHPAHGRVTFPDGSPLRGGMVSFIPLEIRTGFSVRYEGAGLVDKDGNYRIGFNGDGKGVPAGEHKVTIRPRDYMELKGSNSRGIPAKYREEATTPLTVTVNGGDNTFNFVLK